MKNKFVKSGELAKKAGVLPSTIDYYTRNGLLEISGRTQGGYRLYNETEALKRLKEIKKLQEEKRLTIEEIKKELGTK